MAEVPTIYMDSCLFIDLAKYKANISSDVNERNVWFTNGVKQAPRSFDAELTPAHLMCYSSALISIMEGHAIRYLL